MTLKQAKAFIKRRHPAACERKYDYLQVALYDKPGGVPLIITRAANRSKLWLFAVKKIEANEA